MTKDQIWKRISSSPIVRNFTILISGSLLSQLLLLAVLPILTRLYAPEAFGLFASAQSFALILTILTTLRLDILIPIVSKTCDAILILKFIILNSICITLLFVFLSITYILLNTEVDVWQKYASFCFSVIAIFILLPTASALRYLAIRQKHFKKIAFAQINRTVTSSATSITTNIIGIVSPLNATGLIAGHVIGELTFCLSQRHAFTKRVKTYLLSNNWTRVVGVLQQNKQMCITLCSTQMLQVVYGRMPILVIAGTFDLALAGLYAVAERFALAPVSLVSGSAGDVFRQRAASDFNKGKSFRPLFIKFLCIIAALAVLPIFFAIYISINYTGVLLGDEWAAAGDILAIMFITSYFVLTQNPLDCCSLIVGAHNYILRWNLFRFVIISAASIAVLLELIGFKEYIILLAISRIAAALIDITAGYFFSNRAIEKAKSKLLS